MLSRITAFIEDQQSIPGIQLAHAGRKGSTASPWKGGKAVSHEEGGWTPIAPSPIPFDEGYPLPKEISSEEIQEIPRAFVTATQRAEKAGFKVIELHAAHGSLPWPQVLKPAIQLAEQGFVVNSFLSASLEKAHKRLAQFPSTARVLYPGGHVPQPGEILSQPDLARADL